MISSPAHSGGENFPLRFSLVILYDIILQKRNSELYFSFPSQNSVFPPAIHFSSCNINVSKKMAYGFTDKPEVQKYVSTLVTLKGSYTQFSRLRGKVSCLVWQNL